MLGSIAHRSKWHMVWIRLSVAHRRVAKEMLEAGGIEPKYERTIPFATKFVNETE